MEGSEIELRGFLTAVQGYGSTSRELFLHSEAEDYALRLGVRAEVGGVPEPWPLGPGHSYVVRGIVAEGRAGAELRASRVDYVGAQRASTLSPPRTRSPGRATTDTESD